jgi:hypothetical protein
VEPGVRAGLPPPAGDLDDGFYDDLEESDGFRLGGR